MVLVRELEPEPARGRVQHAQAFGNHFLADPVARDHCNALCHGCFLSDVYSMKRAKPLTGSRSVTSVFSTLLMSA